MVEIRSDLAYSTALRVAKTYSIHISMSERIFLLDIILRGGWIDKDEWGRLHHIQGRFPNENIQRIAMEDYYPKLEKKEEHSV